jgi:hypothetical protein
MKDILLTTDGGKFDDIVFEYVDILVNIDPKKPKIARVQRIMTVSDEYKLLQSLKKLLLTQETNHPLGYGVDRVNFSVDEIVKALAFYNDITDSTTLNEQIDEIKEIKQNIDIYSIILTTRAGTTATIGAGI